MDRATKIAIANYDWMLRNRGANDVSLHWDSNTLAYGDGGTSIDELQTPGFTPATRDEAGDQFQDDDTGIDSGGLEGPFVDHDGNTL